MPVSPLHKALFHFLLPLSERPIPETLSLCLSSLPVLFHFSYQFSLVIAFTNKVTSICDGQHDIIWIIFSSDFKYCRGGLQWWYCHSCLLSMYLSMCCSTVYNSNTWFKLGRERHDSRYHVIFPPFFRRLGKAQKIKN